MPGSSREGGMKVRKNVMKTHLQLALLAVVAIAAMAS